MAIFNVSEPQSIEPRGFALFALGFRPFFLAAGWAAVVLVPLWAATFLGLIEVNTRYGTYNWHAHEMLFGYAMAVIAGFLLTAVRNWTGQDTATGNSLMVLVLIWLAGRLLPFTPLPAVLIAGGDLLFLPALAVAIGIPLSRSKQPHNLVFPVLLALLTGANLLVHLAVLAGTDTWRMGIDLTVGLIVGLVIIVGGRVVPFFIERGLPGTQAPKWPKLEILVFVTAAVWLVAKVLAPASPWMAIAAGVAACVHGVRVGLWYTPRLWSVPLLWVLYLGFTWLVVGFLLDALAGFGTVAPSLALHAYTVGTIGTLTLGMMARVSLGHTGRAMQSARPIDVAFVLINVAAFFRIIVPLVFPAAYPTWIGAASIFWLVAFLLFVGVYTPVLIRPRVDGQPG